MANKKNGEEPEQIREPEFLSAYRKAYPMNKKFYVASDNQVFLEGEYKQAQSHQQSLGKGELTTY